jgi:hypothetical protein
MRKKKKQGTNEQPSRQAKIDTLLNRQISAKVDA